MQYYIRTIIYTVRSWFDFMIILPAFAGIVFALDTLSSGTEDIEEMKT